MVTSKCRIKIDDKIHYPSLTRFIIEANERQEPGLMSAWLNYY